GVTDVTTAMVGGATEAIAPTSPKCPLAISRTATSWSPSSPPRARGSPNRPLRLAGFRNTRRTEPTTEATASLVDVLPTLPPTPTTVTPEVRTAWAAYRRTASW